MARFRLTAALAAFFLPRPATRGAVPSIASMARCTATRLTPERLLFVPQRVKDSALRHRHLPSPNSVRHRIAPILRNSRQTEAAGRRLETAAFSGAVGAPLPIPLPQRTPAGSQRLHASRSRSIASSRHALASPTRRPAAPALPPQRHLCPSHTDRTRPGISSSSRPTEARAPDRHEPLGRQPSSTVPELGSGRIRACLQVSALRQCLMPLPAGHEEP